MHFLKIHNCINYDFTSQKRKRTCGTFPYNNCAMEAITSDQILSIKLHNVGVQQCHQPSFTQIYLRASTRGHNNYVLLKTTATINAYKQLATSVDMCNAERLHNGMHCLPINNSIMRTQCAAGVHSVERGVFYPAIVAPLRF